MGNIIWGCVFVLVLLIDVLTEKKSYVTKWQLYWATLAVANLLLAIYFKIGAN